MAEYLQSKSWSLVRLNQKLIKMSNRDQLKEKFKEKAGEKLQEKLGDVRIGCSNGLWTGFSEIGRQITIFLCTDSREYLVRERLKSVSCKGKDFGWQLSSLPWHISVSAPHQKMLKVLDRQFVPHRSCNY